MKSASFHKRNRVGFTLVELLISMAITSVIVFVLLSLVGQSTNTQTMTSRAVNTLSQGRAFLQFFEREMSIRLPRTPLIYQADDGNTPATSDKLAFVRTLSPYEQNAATPGDLATSAYYVAFAPLPGNSTAPFLFRKVLNPIQTQALLDSPGSPSFPDANPDEDEPILDNILSFEVRPQYIDPATGEATDWSSTSPQPASLIELTIRFLDESSARRFKTEAEWNRLASSPKDGELGLIRSFTRTIAIAK